MGVLAVRSGYLRGGDYLRGDEGAPPAGRVLTLLPSSASAGAGTMHTLTATLTLDGAPVVGQRLYFTVEGANPQTYDDVTDALGQVQFSYVGNNVGTDTVSVTSVAGDYGTIVLADAPEFFWRFPDTTDPVPDETGNGLVGQTQGDYTLGVAGVDAEAVEMGAAGSWGYIAADTPVFTPSSGGVETYEFWMYALATPAGGAHHCVIEGQNGFLTTVIWNTVGSVQGIGLRSTGGGTVVCDPNPPELNTWEHYVVIYDDGAEMAYVYRDAELVASGAFSDSMKGFNAIGTSTGSPSLLKARYDEVSYYHRALDEAEITEHYEAVAGETEEATVIWSVFGSGSPGRRTARVVP